MTDDQRAYEMAKASKRLLTLEGWRGRELWDEHMRRIYTQQWREKLTTTP